MLSEKELVKQMKVIGCCNAIVVQKGKEEDLTILPKVVVVLEEYSDVILEELPNGLTPK